MKALAPGMETSNGVRALCLYKVGFDMTSDIAPMFSYLLCLNI